MGRARRPSAPHPPAEAEMAALAERACSTGRAAGLDAVGITTSEPFDDARASIEARIAEGHHDVMAFTFRNPARSTDPRRALRNARSVVVGARSYHRADPGPTADPAGRVAQYAWVDHYRPLRAALRAAGDVLRAAGYRTVVLADDNSMVDRAAAHRAGLGWYGKNANLLLPGSGSWFVLGSVVTDAPLPPSGPPVADGCGSCVRCIDACPTAAIVAPGVVDARRCLAWLAQRPGVFPSAFRRALGDRIYGCDDCQEVCPPNRTSDRRSPPPDPEHDAQPWVALVGLLDATDDELLGAHGRFYLADRSVTTLRRNALIALGNVGRADDPQVMRVVVAALAHGDSIVRGAAVWACGRLGLASLCGPLRSTESDAAVRAELAALT